MLPTMNRKDVVEDLSKNKKRSRGSSTINIWKMTTFVLLGVIVILETDYIELKSISTRSSSREEKRVQIGAKIDILLSNKTGKIEKNHKTWEKKSNVVLDLSSDYRICRLNDPTPQYGQPRLTDETSPLLQEIGIPVKYQCEGPDYDNFMQQYQYPFIVNRSANGFPHWGKRPTILPPPPTEGPGSSSRSSSKGRTILFLGNSHTRQALSSMLCQYRDHIDSYVPLVDINVPGSGFRQKYVLKSSNNDNLLTIYGITNSAYIYSKKWKSNLEYILDGQKLNSLDAIVHGQFNNYDPVYNSTQMWQYFRLYATRLPNQEIDIDRHPHGFQMRELAKAYQGPIVAVSMLTDKGNYWNIKATDELHKLQAEGRTNVRVVISKQHYKAMGQNCQSFDSKLVSTCTESDKTSHSCMGEKGGLPDMVSWDIIEALWDLFPSI